MDNRAFDVGFNRLGHTSLDKMAYNACTANATELTENHDLSDDNRLDIARRIYDLMCLRYPDRQVMLADSRGCMVARSDGRRRKQVVELDRQRADGAHSAQTCPLGFPPARHGDQKPPRPTESEHLL